jgi:hypothetical protein
MASINVDAPNTFFFFGQKSHWKISQSYHVVHMLIDFMFDTYFQMIWIIFPTRTINNKVNKPLRDVTIFYD